MCRRIWKFKCWFEQGIIFQESHRFCMWGVERLHLALEMFCTLGSSSEKPLPCDPSRESLQVRLTLSVFPILDEMSTCHNFELPCGGGALPACFSHALHRSMSWQYIIALPLQVWNTDFQWKVGCWTMLNYVPVGLPSLCISSWDSMGS